MRFRGVVTLALILAFLLVVAFASCRSPHVEVDDDDVASPPPRYHAVGYGDPAIHAIEAKMQVLGCENCHGATLEGIPPAASCDHCHRQGWRTDCIYCHGGVENATGAPPRYIDGLQDSPRTLFKVHAEHVAGRDHRQFDCVQCHAKPTDVLTPGHLFVDDTSGGLSEVRFAGGLSPMGEWTGDGCTNLYCHGSGRGDDGEILADAGERACDSCHPNQDSGRDAWGSMSGQHELHLGHDVTCSECHATVISGGSSNEPGTIVEPELHVDGVVETSLPPGMRFSNGTCDGDCHDESHSEREWEE